MTATIERQCSCGATFTVPDRKMSGPPRTKCDVCRQQRMKRRPLCRPPRSTAFVECITNVVQAIDELTRAREELKAIEQVEKNTTTHERRALLIEPLSRMDLAQRFLTETLRKHGWTRIEVDK